MSDITKRLNYFDRQFLRAKDFQEEQAYFQDRRQRHNRLLHSPGVAEGLRVVGIVGDTSVAVEVGTALDPVGREIVVASKTPAALPGAPVTRAEVWVAFSETPSDPSGDPGVAGQTRIAELPNLIVRRTLPVSAPDNIPDPQPANGILLAELTLANGALTQLVVDKRMNAGTKLGDDFTVARLTLKNDAVPANQWPQLSCSAANLAALAAANLRLENGREIFFQDNGQIRSLDDNHRIVFDRANNQLELHEFGDILFLAGGAPPSEKMRIQASGNVGIGTPAPENSEGWNKVLDILGPAHAKLSVRTSAVDARVMAHNLGFFNAPAGMIMGTRSNHPVSLATNGAAQLTLSTAGDLGLGTTNPQGTFHIARSTPNVFLLGNTTQNQDGMRLHYNETANLRTGVIDVRGLSLRIRGESAGPGSGATERVFLDLANGNVGIGTTSPGFRLDVADRVRLRQGGAGTAGMWLFQAASNADRAFVGMANDNQVGLWGNAGAGWGVVMDVTNGNLSVRGSIAAGGGKGGYVMDQFVNRLGETLEQGDVIVVGKNQSSLFYGQDDNIPILEVDLTSKANDTRVCGIVAQVHADAPQNAADTPGKGRMKRGKADTAAAEVPIAKESTKDDLIRVQTNQIGWMVTLGAYAHCKVDADIAPIEVGDLLTTSPTKAHAQKVLDPGKATGAILGKALGTLKKGKGKIPILVMLQ